ncbi:MAG TPA: polyhydroxyalkanoic acid system family protein [Thermomicrobiales bacterium]|nr:polyhydroxyalkanoic acid system family protein [Thermomicrobiales bacterium]HRA48286.1 polyhydroxyalkanoic acid system family protein [Thermomicrobiales bacterium]
MPKIAITVPHTLGANEATTRIQGLLGEVKRDFGDQVTDLSETWTGHGAEFAFRVMGMQVSGTLQIADHLVQMQGDIPFAALPFKSRIEAMVRKRTEQLLAQ